MLLPRCARAGIGGRGGGGRSRPSPQSRWPPAAPARGAGGGAGANPPPSRSRSNVAAGLAVGFGAGAAAAYLVTRPDPASLNRPAVPVGPVPSSSHPALRHGAPPADAVREFPGFAVGHDARHRIPRWVAEAFDRETSRGAGDRSQHFFQEDDGVDPRWRATNADYQGSGYDRGHMAPAADFKGDPDALAASFSLSNVAPQVGAGFNRDYWARLERFIKTLATEPGSGVVVFTGPLFLPTKKTGSNEWAVSYAAIGTAPRLVSVPTHFYKVALVTGPRGPLGRRPAAVAAFVVPNARVDPAAPLTAFCVPLSALEDAAGARFFADAVDGGGGAAALDAAALRWQAAGRAGRARLPKGDPAGLLPLGERDAALAKGAPAVLAPAAPAPAKKRGRPRNHAPPPDPAPRFVWPGAGVAHLCDATKCVLPAEEWWKEGRKEKKQEGSAAESDAGGGD